jgi:hypothetical protein
MNRETFIARLTEVQQIVKHDAFAAHLYRSRREFRSACERAGKSGKQIEFASSRRFESPRAWALRANFDNGRTFCASAIENLRLAVGAANSAKGAAA